MTTPIPPERFASWRAAVAQMAGPRRAEFAAARRRQCIDLTQPAGPPPDQIFAWSADEPG